jgi:hypothetical protein
MKTVTGDITINATARQVSPGEFITSVSLTIEVGSGTIDRVHSVRGRHASSEEAERASIAHALKALEAGLGE